MSVTEIANKNQNYTPVLRVLRGSLRSDYDGLRYRGYLEQLLYLIMVFIFISEQPDI